MLRNLPHNIFHNTSARSRDGHFNASKAVPDDACIVINSKYTVLYASAQWREGVTIFNNESGSLIGLNVEQLFNCCEKQTLSFTFAESLCSTSLYDCVTQAMMSNYSGELASYSLGPSNDGALGVQATFKIETFECGAVITHQYSHIACSAFSGLTLSDHFYTAFFDSLESGVIYQSLNGYIILANDAAVKMFNLSYKNGQNETLFHPDRKFLNAHGQYLKDEDSPVLQTIRKMQPQKYRMLGIKKTDGTIIWVNVNTTLIFAPQTDLLQGLLISIENVSKETRVKRELENVSERLKLALDGAQIGIWDWYIEKDQLIWDDQMYKHFGIDKHSDQSVNKSWVTSAHPEDLLRVQQETQNIVSTKVDGYIEFRAQINQSDIRYLRTYVRPVIAKNGQVERVVGMVWDISKEVAAEKRIEQIAFTDELTELPNRRGFNNTLNDLIDNQKNILSTITLLVIDVDHFKDINDSYGHLVGDDLIKEVTALIKQALTSNEYLARVGGDEFAVISTQLKDKHYAHALGEKIQNQFKEPVYLLGGQVINVRISVGISMYPTDGKDAISVIKAADLSIHYAKGTGRNNVVCYKQAYSNELATKLYLERELRCAIRDEELLIYYQPIIDLSTNNVLGCEALLRWIDKNGKFVSPMSFIPVAEESGLIYQLGHWINMTVFKQLNLWKSLNVKLQYVSINVSPHQLQNPNFIRDLRKLLTIHKIDPKEIQLEITEGTFLQESINSTSHLRELGEMGFRLAIDDFGTGYSSLAYLKRFDVDVIKIDRSFVKDLEDDPADRDIVKAIIAMTKSLGFETLVEGVETKEQSLIVSALGCGYGQGYLYGRPTFADDFAEKYIGLGKTLLPSRSHL